MKTKENHSFSRKTDKVSCFIAVKETPGENFAIFISN